MFRFISVIIRQIRRYSCENAFDCSVWFWADSGSFVDAFLLNAVDLAQRVGDIQQ